MVRIDIAWPTGPIELPRLLPEYAVEGLREPVVVTSVRDLRERGFDLPRVEWWFRYGAGSYTPVRLVPQPEAPGY